MLGHDAGIVLFEWNSKPAKLSGPAGIPHCDLGTMPGARVLATAAMNSGRWPSLAVAVVGIVTSIWLSGGCRDETIPMTVKMAAAGVDLKAIGEISACRDTGSVYCVS
jgi:hypothetical protein